MTPSLGRKCMEATQPNCRPFVRSLLTGCALLALWAAGSYFLHLGGSVARNEGQGERARAQMMAMKTDSPVGFEVNQGQTDPEVKYLARGPGYTLFLTSNAAVWSLRSGSAAANGRKAGANTELRMQIAGADSHASIAGADRLKGVSNYYIGDDPDKWHTNVAHYGRVGYKEVYPGVNLSWHGGHNQLDIDFAVAPAADPSVINLHFSGTEKLAIASSGDLVVSTAAGDFCFHKPVAYQERNGIRDLVDAHFVVKNTSDIGFAIATYDRRRELMIEPTLSYSTAQAATPVSASVQIKSAIVEFSQSATWLLFTTLLPIAGLALAGIATTPHRKKMLAGVLMGFVVSGLVFMMACGSSGGRSGGVGGGGGGGNGRAIALSQYLGGSGDDQGHSIALDSSGNIYITGESSSTNFPGPSGSPTFTGGQHDAFIMKLNSSGAVQYATFIGGTTPSANAVGLGIAVDSSGNAFIVGNTNGQGFPTPPTPNSTFGRPGGQDVFVAEFSPTGTPMFATVIAGTATESGNGIALDGSGDIFIAGETDSADFPTLPNASQRSFGGGGSDGFVVELRAGAGGLSPIYSTYLGGSGKDLATGIGLTGGKAYVTGVTQGNVAGASNTFGGIEDGFVAEFDTSISGPSSRIYFTYVGGSGDDVANAITVDNTGATYITGKTTSSSLPSAVGSLSGTQDAFVAKLNPTGTIAFTSYLGGSGGPSGDFDEGIAIALDSSGNIYVTGSTTSTDFPTVSAINGGTALQGPNDAFITEFNSSGSSKNFSTYFGGTGSEDEISGGFAGAIAVDSTGNIFATGSTSSSAGVQGPPSNSFGGGPSDAYLVKIGP
jgi:Beta-propeller repeat